jgi:hypothetical protein
MTYGDTVPPCMLSFRLGKGISPMIASDRERDRLDVESDSGSPTVVSILASRVSLHDDSTSRPMICAEIDIEK